MLIFPYEIKHYKRDPDTNRAPDELRAIHPLGKSPVIENGDDIVAETGAIIVYILDKYGKGKLRPERDAPEYLDYVHFLHFAEGSAMLPLLLALYTGFLGEAAAPIQPMIMKEIKGVLDYCEYRLVRSEYFAGNMMTGAGYEACNEFVDKIHKRPAYLRALEKGGDYAYGPK